MGSISTLITGGFGFIGSVLIAYLITETVHDIIKHDARINAANLVSLEDVVQVSSHRLVRGDTCDHGH